MRSCHEKAETQFATSIHRTPRSNGQAATSTCFSCHGSSHDMLPVKHLDSPVFKFNLPDLRKMPRGRRNGEKARPEGKRHESRYFRDSIHGRACSRWA